MKQEAKDCLWVLSQLSAWHDGELDPDERERVEQHLRVCSTCAREARALAAVDRLVRELPVEWPEPAYWPDLRASVADARGARSAERPEERLFSWIPGIRWNEALAGASLAAALVTLVLLIWQGGQFQPTPDLALAPSVESRQIPETSAFALAPAEQPQRAARAQQTAPQPSVPLKEQATAGPEVIPGVPAEEEPGEPTPQSSPGESIEQHPPTFTYRAEPRPRAAKPAEVEGFLPTDRLLRPGKALLAPRAWTEQRLQADVRMLAPLLKQEAERWRRGLLFAPAAAQRLRTNLSYLTAGQSPGLIRNYLLLLEGYRDYLSSAWGPQEYEFEKDRLEKLLGKPLPQR